jgi:hypothetical protein
MNADAAAFEQNHRMTSLVLQGGTDTFATNNRFGGAFTSLGRQQAQQGIDDTILDGSFSILVGFPGLTDLRGSNASSFAVALLNGAPVLPPGNPATYSGTSDLDWWYEMNRDEVDPAGNPLNSMPASIAASVLNAGPGQVIFPEGFGGAEGSFALWDIFLQANVGASSAPLRSTNNFPPGHRVALDPALLTFQAMTQGRLRGNISAASLASTPVPSTLAADGATACSQGYGPTNTFLDLIVGGCTVLIIGVVTPSQPDRFDPNAPVLGAGPPYTFVRTGNRVTAARDRLAAVVDLQGAVNASAYSCYFTFTSDRVIAFNEPSEPVRLTDPAALANGAFRFQFTNAPRATFSVLSATNVETHATNWSVLGVPSEGAPGVYEFVDPGATTNQPRRFYGVRSP